MIYSGIENDLLGAGCRHRELFLYLSFYNQWIWYPGYMKLSLRHFLCSCFKYQLTHINLKFWMWGLRYVCIHFFQISMNVTSWMVDVTRSVTTTMAHTAVVVMKLVMCCSRLITQAIIPFLLRRQAYCQETCFTSTTLVSVCTTLFCTTH